MDKNSPPPPSEEAKVEAAPAAEDKGFGPWLLEQRTAKNVSLEEIAAVTKVHISQLQHLEADEFSKLPAAAFVRGFLISYARYLGIDEDEILTRFRKASGADKRAAEAPRSIRAAQSASQARVSVVDFPNFQNTPNSRGREPEPSKIFNLRNGVVVAVIVVVVGLLGFLIVLGRKSARAKGEAAVAAKASTPSDATAAAAPAVAAGVTPGVATGAAAGTTAGVAPAGPVTPPTTHVEAKPVYEFEIRAIEPTWLSVRIDDDDPKGITLAPGKTHSGGAQRRVNLSLSNAGVVEIRWGGVWYEAPGFRGDVRALQLPEQLKELKPKGSAVTKVPRRAKKPVAANPDEAPGATPPKSDTASPPAAEAPAPTEAPPPESD